MATSDLFGDLLAAMLLASLAVHSGCASVTVDRLEPATLEPTPVRSKLAWWFFRTLNAVRGEAPMLRWSNMPGGAGGRGE